MRPSDSACVGTGPPSYFSPDFDTVIANAQVSEARREVFVTTRVG